MFWWHRNIIGIIINHRNCWYAHLPPAQCSTIASNNHYAGSYMENYPKGSEGESLVNIGLLDRKKLRFVVIGSSDRHTDCSGPNFDPPSLSTHVKPLILLNHYLSQVSQVRAQWKMVWKDKSLASRWVAELFESLKEPCITLWLASNDAQRIG